MSSPNHLPLKTHLLDLTYSELESAFGNFSQESYRLDQLCDWIFVQRADHFDAMSNLPLSLRNLLSEKFFLRSLNVLGTRRSQLDHTVKFTFKERANRSISAVSLAHSKYRSLCISTQVGCAWKCRFCASGLVPFQRNLSSGEILDQLFLAETETHQKAQNVLFMGMGEPLANYNGTVKTIRWLTSPRGFKMHPTRVTLSTTGLAPQIKKIAEERLGVHLALSLHAPTDELRKKIMPLSARFRIKDVLTGCKNYQGLNDSDLTIEYILLKDINDTLKTAGQLSGLIDSIRFYRRPKINLIPYNPVPELPFQPPLPDRAQAFFNFLKKKKFIVHTRRAQGQDIDAACGQLL